MAKQIPITLLVTVVISIFALSAATGVVAQERPLECVAGGKFTFTPLPEAGAWPISEPAGGRCGEFPGNLWLYRVTPSNPKFLAKVNKIYFYIPSSPPNIIEVSGYEALGLRGEGGISGWGAGIYNGIVVTATSYSGTGNYLDVSFCTKDVATYGLVSPVVDTGPGGELGCEAEEPASDLQGPVGGIVGPGFDISELIVAEVTRDVFFPAGGCVRIKKHPVTGCIKEFRRCDDGDGGQGTLIPGSQDGPDWITTTVADLGNFEARLCRSGVISGKFGTSTDYQYWGNANGWWYCIGTYSTDEPLWCNFCDVCED